MIPPPQLVFIVGFARSGTTLLATLLDRHSQIAATPETHFFDQVVPRAATPTDQHDAPATVAAFLASSRVKDLILSIDDFASLLDHKTCSWRDVYSRALEVYAARGHAQIVAEKTPAHITKIPRILEWYPDARVIHIIRDGRDAVLSLLRAPWTHSNLRRHARTWRWCMKRMESFRQQYPQRILEIRYEELLTDTENTLRKLSSFIGVGFEPAQVQPGGAAGPIPNWEAEWKEKASAGLDPSRIQAWKRDAGLAQRWVMNSMMGRVLGENGYNDTSLADCPKLVRVKNGAANACFLVAYHPMLKPCFVILKRAMKGIGMPTDQIDRPGRRNA